jgi:branched-subunit amino acid transport protein
VNAAAESWLGWALIAGTAIVVYFTRAVFVLPGSRLRLPPLAERVLRYAPAAALAAIIVPDLALLHGAWAVAPDNPRLVGGLVAFAVAAATRSILLTIAGGMLAMTAVRLIAG